MCVEFLSLRGPSWAQMPPKQPELWPRPEPEPSCDQFSRPSSAVSPGHVHIIPPLNYLNVSPRASAIRPHAPLNIPRLWGG